MKKLTTLCLAACLAAALATPASALDCVGTSSISGTVKPGPDH